MSQIFGDTDDKRALYEALTRYNYFPNQRANIGELPPSLIQGNLHQRWQRLFLSLKRLKADLVMT